MMTVETREPIVHDLKCWPEFFAAVRDGLKQFEVRKNDRDFRVGDTLRLWEFDPKLNIHTGMYFHRRVTYALTGGQFGVEEGHVVLGLADGRNLSATADAAVNDGGDEQ